MLWDLTRSKMSELTQSDRNLMWLLTLWWTTDKSRCHLHSLSWFKCNLKVSCPAKETKLVTYRPAPSQWSPSCVRPRPGLHLCDPASWSASADAACCYLRPLQNLFHPLPSSPSGTRSHPSKPTDIQGKSDKIFMIGGQTKAETNPWKNTCAACATKSRSKLRIWALENLLSATLIQDQFCNWCSILLPAATIRWSSLPLVDIVSTATATGVMDTVGF